MPWTMEALPDVAKNWTAEEQIRCIAAGNSALKDGKTDAEAIFACIRAAGKSETEAEAGKAITLKNQAKRLLADMSAILEEKALP
ncbi:MAG: hypothetical protein V1755_03645, partial [Chloroflexota bacterium]